MNEFDRDPMNYAAARMLRVKLPLRYHLWLHHIKLTTGKSMANVVQDALSLYFEQSERPAAPGPRPTEGFPE
jgi:hypothetical protein